ncbi:conserved hypothetical protein [Pseudomonas sp. OF001]|uniref:hypothetical protein n=1 Tax=Pseudomonas sp. OF001 TaxID=2772300 RepID=UPI001919FEB8|nr:hypothetical protein [Pseudomonas sp. OF001]CAD5376758.1 conserved hypothetical protein [Pseudomonas sp. OF001]
MSTFAVFGMTEHFAREEAKKKTPAKKTMQEWLDAVEARVDQVLEGPRCVQLSNLFDAPQFAQQYIELLRKSGRCRDLRIRAKVKVERPAEARGKKKAPSTTWKDVA